MRTQEGPQEVAILETLGSRTDTFPTLIADLHKVKGNARFLTDTVAPRIDVFGVTKGCAGSVPVARAMLDGGVVGLADSRLSQLQRLRAAFPETPLMALRQPLRGEMHEMLPLGATAVVSDMVAAQALSREAQAAGRTQSIILMVEMGDGREGIEPEALEPFAAKVSGFPGLCLAGLACNPGCSGGRSPDGDSMRLLDKMVNRLRKSGIALEIVSAGNSSCWRLLKSGELAATTNHLRLGEAILLGREAIAGEHIEGLHADAFIVRAEIIESSDKLGGRRLVLAIGRQDAGAGQLAPVDSRLRVDRLTSDHCVLIAPAGWSAMSGDTVDFIPSYFALQSVSASPHVMTTYIRYNNECLFEEIPMRNGKII